MESCVQCKSICKNNDYLLDLALTLIWKNNIQCNVLHVLPNSNIEEEICEFPSFLGFLILWIFTRKKSYTIEKFLMISFSYYRFCWKEMYWKWNLVFEFRSFRMDKFYNLRSNGCPFEARICPCDPIWIFCYSIDSCNYYIFCIQVCVAEDKFFENNLHFYTNAKSFPHFLILTKILE